MLRAFLILVVVANASVTYECKPEANAFYKQCRITEIAKCKVNDLSCRSWAKKVCTEKLFLDTTMCKVISYW